MRCSKCGFKKPHGMRFCGQCTTPLALVCPNCQFENPPGFKFCGQCTSTLGPVTAKPEPLRTSLKARESDDSAVLDGERKTVTALFADIKGSTELMEELDPEKARAIIDPALKIMVEAVRRYEGYVVQSTGDGIFALFGAPAGQMKSRLSVRAVRQIHEFLASRGWRRFEPCRSRWFSLSPYHAIKCVACAAPPDLALIEAWILARETGEGNDGWRIPGEILSLLHVTAAMSATPP